MTGEKQQGIDVLVACGLNPEVARRAVRYGEIPTPLPPDALRNLELLGRYMDLQRITLQDCAKLTLFLKRDFAVNALLASVPERYSFSECQSRAYWERPLQWDMACDLKAELDEQLRRLLPEEQLRMDVYREMYGSGAWWDCETLREICRELQALAPGQEPLERMVKEWWHVLFSYYSGTLSYIAALKETFAPECVWEILCEQPDNVREFTAHWKQFDRKDEVMEALKRKHGRCLAEQRAQ